MESGYLRAAMALSAAGMVLVPVFGLLLRFQPTFVHGLRVSASAAEVNCYLVGGLYACVFLVCGLLLTLKTRGCLDRKQHEAQDDVTRRNQRYGLRFVELESKEFVRSMDAMDRSTQVTPAKSLELPTKFPSKADPV
ncbi:hypothetical protein PF005_g11005 [Phytophthora fragariae]|uniref:Uncharacterized protein n=1 Tax=Phytophthora fragariae TaxID=53985 RepID=A0A6A3EZ17_9STRA|nr:hypothetical protein PF003_g18061 [Phytophthora fragariae]KAE8938685.1 hypothetical protein PF009_g11444 [Phytophthora fragariae]KAE9010660.1 hypothetical protein PF011_g9727 [Phytophthora fragariae]KAE9113817.1 hypothetical protein PF007_g10606 [Phytophthora fragariae]KAE9144105.1 hypothetical protein PF006_g10926 [Phytophthora fragariae]